MSIGYARELEVRERTQLGFWLYLMTDCMLFAGLFATFVVLRNATADGPSGAEIFELPTVLLETIILLTSSFVCGMGLIALKQGALKLLIPALIMTGLLGAAFLSIEVSEFASLINEGNSWQQSAFLSAFFVLVGTHGLHILIGLIWAATLIIYLVRKGITEKSHRQVLLFVLFWHFLDLIWIFVFTVVYLMGVTI